jgi:thiamine-phosphate pyrophosphorylase
LKHDYLHGLYAITDARSFAGRDMAECVAQALQGGARIIQYRDKSEDQKQRLQQAQALRTLCDQHRALLIINDDVALAKQVGADGVHLGIDDIDISEARALLGADSIIGVSCYNRFELAEQAAAQNADYLAFGAFYSSPTKPAAVRAEIELLQRAQQFDLPLCAIGGITPENATALIEAGADMLAVISGVFAATDINAEARRFATLEWRTHSPA